MEEGKCECHDVPLKEVEFGKTRIFDTYDKEDLIGYADYQNSTVYVSDDAHDRVKKVFHVEEDNGDTWFISTACNWGEYKVSPLSSISLEHTINDRDLVALAKRFCKKYNKDDCLNFYRGNTFVYSWKAVIETHLCTKPSTEDCSEIWQTNTVTLYPQKDCKGTPFKRKKKWAYCSPV